jgi:hypothetical protein
MKRNKPMKGIARTTEIPLSKRAGSLAGNIPAARKKDEIRCARHCCVLPHALIDEFLPSVRQR